MLLHRMPIIIHPLFFHPTTTRPPPPPPSPSPSLSKFTADFFVVPNFLNTCEGTSKALPMLVDDGVHVMPSELELQREVKAMALKFREEAPVVIICGSSHERRKALILALGGESVEKGVLEIAAGGEKITEKVDCATKKVKGEEGDFWPISVVDYEGGRGQDYNILDRGVDRSGGLVVIITEIPVKGEREWVQWKGRTARSDRKGRYAVILSNVSKEALKDVEGRENVYDVKLVDKLLRGKDLEIEQNLKEKADDAAPQNVKKFVQTPARTTYKGTYLTPPPPRFPLPHYLALFVTTSTSTSQAN